MSQHRLPARPSHAALSPVAICLLLIVGVTGCGQRALTHAAQSAPTARPALTATPTSWLPTPVVAPPCGSPLEPGLRDGQDVLLPAILWQADAVAAPHAPVHYTSPACAADIARFFQARLPADGWRLVAAQQQDAQQYEARFRRAAVEVDILITGYPDDSGCYVIIQD